MNFLRIYLFLGVNRDSWKFVGIENRKSFKKQKSWILCLPIKLGFSEDLKLKSASIFFGGKTLLHDCFSQVWYTGWYFNLILSITSAIGVLARNISRIRMC